MITDTTLAVLDITVHGRPATQGSKTAFVVRPRNGRPRAVMREAGAVDLKPWREAVRSTAAEALHAASNGPWAPVSGPVTVVLTFALPKPASAPKRRRTWPVAARSGDVDKLARACLDALTDSGVWCDDAQVVALTAVKDYAGSEGPLLVPGVRVQVFRVLG